MTQFVLVQALCVQAIEYLHLASFGCQAHLSIAAILLVNRELVSFVLQGASLALLMWT